MVMFCFIFSSINDKERMISSYFRSLFKSLIYSQGLKILYVQLGQFPTRKFFFFFFFSSSSFFEVESLKTFIQHKENVHHKYNEKNV